MRTNCFKMVFKSIICTLAMTLWFTGLGWAEQRPTLTFAVSTSTSEVVAAYKQFFDQAYDRIGYDIKIHRLPTKRAYCHAEVDKIDGLLISPATIMEKYQNLIMVPVPLRSVALVVYTRAFSFQVEGFESLRPYKIGVLRGYPICEKNTASMDRFIVNSFQSLFSMLDLGRLDIVLGLKSEADRFLADHPEIKGIRTLDPPLMTLNIYHFIHLRHRDLIPRLTPVMEDLLARGVMKALYAPFERRNEKGSRPVTSPLP